MIYNNLSVTIFMCSKLVISDCDRDRDVINFGLPSCGISAAEDQVRETGIGNWAFLVQLLFGHMGPAKRGTAF